MVMVRIGEVDECKRCAKRTFVCNVSSCGYNSVGSVGR